MSGRKSSIPTLLALFILILVLVGLTLGRDQVTRLFTKASTGDFGASNIEISNVSENGWTVTWTTAVKSTGVVYFGKTELVDEGVVLDDRDTPSLVGEFTTHSVTVRNARTGVYFFKIGVGRERVGRDGITPYSVIVPSNLSAGGKIDPIYGRVKLNTGAPARNAIVIFTAAGSQTLSVLTNDDGDYVVPLTTLRTVNLKDYLELKDGISEQLKIIGEDLSSAVVSCLAGYDRPVPTVTLGSSLSCSKGTPNLPRTSP